MTNLSVRSKSETVFDVINSVERGDLTTDLDNAVRAVVAAAEETGKGGSVTLTLTIRPDAQLGAIRVGGQVKAKTPVKVTKEALFFTTDEGSLSRYNSKQRDMFIEPEPTAPAAETETNYDKQTGEVIDG
jgi:hypothetical protein